MHVIEAATIMANTPPVGQGDTSQCLPGWIETMCNAYEKGDGYTLSHDAVGALAHMLICARVRCERLVSERDKIGEQLVTIQNMKVFIGVSYGRCNETQICGVSNCRETARRFVEQSRNETLNWDRRASEDSNSSAGLEDTGGDLVGHVLKFDITCAEK